MSMPINVFTKLRINNYPGISLCGISFSLMLLLIFSCSEEQTFTIGDNLTEIKGDVILVDTATINSFTIKFDSLQTSGSNYALVGNYNDGILGNITASTYFKISLPSVTSLSENAKFDSICLILKPTGYCYGDSTLPFSMEVHQLTDDLENDEVSEWYNTSQLKYSSDILSTKTAVIKPNAGKNLTVKLVETFGKNLFDIIYNEGEEIESQDNFNKYLKGFALIPSGTTGNSVMQFSMADSIAIMRLYYHAGQEDYTIDFNIYQTSVQYNKISANYNNSILKELKTKEYSLPSARTAHTTYCQAGTGVMTRLEFPYLKSIFQAYSAYKILKADLVIKPVKGTYSLIPLPTDINLYYTNTLNDFGSVLSDSDGNTINPILSVDKMYNQTSYTFDLTRFITSSMNNIKDDAPSLLLSINSNYLGYSLERLCLGDSKHPTDAVQLKIVFWKY